MRNLKWPDGKFIRLGDRLAGERLGFSPALDMIKRTISDSTVREKLKWPWRNDV